MSVLWRGKSLLLSALIIPALFCINLCAQTIPADYQAWFDAVRLSSASKHADAIGKLAAVWSAVPPSPLKGKAALLAARSNLALGETRPAATVLQRNYDALPQPEGDLLLGTVLAAAGQPAEAVACYQRVYYRFPLRPEAAEAEAALSRLSASLGSEFPPALPQSVMGRAEQLRKAGQSARAQAELLAAIPGFAGQDRDLAAVRARYGDYRALSELQVSAPEADAERIYLMHAAARRNSMSAEAESSLRQLETTYPKSRWTMEALISWGNHFLVRNQPDNYVALYRRVYQNFPSSLEAASCHWKVTWAAWIRREPQAQALMEEHAARFPDSESASAALYFTARYAEIPAKWPLSYYAVLARKKTGTQPSKSVKPDASRFAATEETRIRIARAVQLEKAGFVDWAEFELKYMARAQPWLAAMELSETATRRGDHGQALRYVKSNARGYLSLAFEAAPLRFWKVAFPLPFREAVAENSEAVGIDAAMIAALIRQESEFDPTVISRARAYGLTQLLPSTGRQVSRELGIRGFRTDMLFRPELNLRLGTRYLQSMLAQHGGKWEETLAAYNAGKGRVDLWKTWYSYRDPAEFVETIPFTETRNYVQVVLRNADMYRRVYGRGMSQPR